MICKRIEPSLSVCQYIKEYSIVHLAFDTHELAPIKTYPINPNEGITFQFIGKLIAETPDLNYTETRPKVNIFGIPSARQNFLQTHEFMFVNVLFQPLALFQFLKIPMTELHYGCLDASLILGKEIEQVNDQLANTTDYEAIPAILNSYFLKKINQIKANFLPINQIGRLISANPSSFNLDKTASDACMSHRNFERTFLQQLGVTPKHYARISRFYHAWTKKQVNPKLDWLSIAIDNGYTDYQHLVKDFKQFAGVTPNILIEQSNLNPEKRLLINPEFVGI